MAGEVHTWAEAAHNIALVLRAGRAGVPADLQRIGTRLVSELRLDLSKPGRGRTYTTYFYTGRLGHHLFGPGGPFQTPGKLYAWPPRSKPHTASAPGDPPAVDTGELRASYGHSVQATPAGADLRIASGSDHAAYMEFGTSRIKPRPHLRPLMARNALKIRSEIEQGIEARERAMARRLGGRG